MAHFELTRSLKGAHTAIVGIAPTFFNLSVEAHAQATILHAARIFDRKPGTVSIHALLALVSNRAGTFKHANAMQIRKDVTEASRTVAKLEPIVGAVKTRRNETLAHSDPRAFIEYESYVEDGRVSYRQLEGLYIKTDAILNHFFQAYNGRGFPPNLLTGIEDVTALLQFILDSLRERRAPS